MGLFLKIRKIRLGFRSGRPATPGWGSQKANWGKLGRSVRPSIKVKSSSAGGPCRWLGSCGQACSYNAWPCVPALRLTRMKENNNPCQFSSYLYSHIIAISAENKQNYFVHKKWDIVLWGGMAHSIYLSDLLLFYYMIACSACIWGFLLHVVTSEARKGHRNSYNWS